MDKKELAEWKSLYEITLKIKALNPWRFLEEVDFVTISMPTHSQTIYVNVFLNDDSFYGIGMYSTVADIKSIFTKIIGDPNPYFNPYAEQSGLFTIFSPRKDVSKVNYETIKELDYRFRGDGNWLQFQSYVKGLEPWNLSRREVRFMTRCLSLYYKALLALDSGELDVDFENGEIVHVYYSEFMKNWQQTITTMEWPGELEEYDDVEIHDDLLLKRINKKAQTNQTVEVASFFLSTLTKESASDRGVVPKVCLITDQQSELILSNKISTHPDEEIKIVVNSVIDFMLKAGPPKLIFVNQAELYYYLLDLCQKIGTELRFVKTLPVMTPIVEDMLHMH